MKNGQTIDLGMTGYDELFMTDKERAENKLPKIYDVPLSEIDDFPEHPFQVRLDEDMQQLVESIKERGLITPIMLRQKEDGRYEIVSGHRRKKACEIAGFDAIKAEIRDMTRDEAIITMVESNLQRSVILPSEKALAYKMRLEAMNRQGQRTDLTSGPVGQKLDNVNSREELASNSIDSARQIQRYIRLTELIPELLEKVDEGQIAMRPAVELSYLKENEQRNLIGSMEYYDSSPSHVQAIEMRELSKAGKLGPRAIDRIMSQEKPNQKPHISIRYEDVKRYIPESIPYKKTGEYVMQALQYYQRYLERQRSDRDGWER